jgi:rod shape-determining protein MreB
MGTPFLPTSDPAPRSPQALAMFRSVLGAISSEMAIDLGTATTRIAVAGRGLVCSEASAVAIHEDRGSRRILAVGEAALEMLGRTPPEIRVVRPIIDGMLSDFEIAEEMLRHLMMQVHGRSLWVGPRVTVCIPYNTIDMEKRAIRKLMEAAGAREVRMVEQPIAAAVGAELPIGEAQGHMVVDVGAGTSEVGVISLGGVVYSRTVKVGGEHMDRAIIHHIRTEHGLLIGPRTAEQLKCELGSALPVRRPALHEVKGRDLKTGYPRALEITAQEVHEALRSPVQLIIDAVRASLEHTPPELAADVAQTGIVMTGGGAMLSRLDRALSEATGLPVIVPEDPDIVLVKGALRCDEPRTGQAVAG